MKVSKFLKRLGIRKDQYWFISYQIKTYKAGSLIQTRIVNGVSGGHPFEFSLDTLKFSRELHKYLSPDDYLRNQYCDVIWFKKITHKEHMLYITKEREYDQYLDSQHSL